MSPSYDVVVIGLGGMSASSARRGSVPCTAAAPAAAVPGSPGSRVARAAGREIAVLCGGVTAGRTP